MTQWTRERQVREFRTTRQKYSLLEHQQPVVLRDHELALLVEPERLGVLLVRRLRLLNLAHLGTARALAAP